MLARLERCCCCCEDDDDEGDVSSPEVRSSSITSSVRGETGPPSPPDLELFSVNLELFSVEPDSFSVNFDRAPNVPSEVVSDVIFVVPWKK